MPKINTVATEKLNTGTDAGAVPKSIQRGRGNSHAKTPVSTAEAEKLKREMKTQGRAGVKMQRLNLAVTPENDKAVRIIAAATGQSMIRVFNKMIDEYRKNHKDLIESAEKVIKEFEGE